MIPQMDQEARSRTDLAHLRWHLEDLEDEAQALIDDATAFPMLNPQRHWPPLMPFLSESLED
jgi:hypothetical protein